MKKILFYAFLISLASSSCALAMENEQQDWTEKEYAECTSLCYSQLSNEANRYGIAKLFASSPMNVEYKHCLKKCLVDYQVARLLQKTEKITLHCSNI